MSVYKIALPGLNVTDSMSCFDAVILLGIVSIFIDHVANIVSDVCWK